MNEKIEKVLISLRNKKSREEVAKEFGYKSYKSLDMYMRRKNYTYDSNLQNYKPNNKDKLSKDSSKKVYTNIPAKAASIIKLFEKENPDPKAIANLMRFSSYNEMAVYMKSKGYAWNNEKQNYILNTEITEYEEEAVMKEEIDNNSLDNKGFEKYIPLLDILDKNKETLLKQLLPLTNEGAIPRFIIPGVFITKSIHMSSSLDQLVKEFSFEKNISQREIFEVAIVDFFNQYGYKKEIETLLKS